MRRQISSWCDARGVPAPLGRGADYAAPGHGGHPLVADDGDVAVVAAHVARFATDTLARSENSIFPYSAYAIGLSRGWIFADPFDTWPIGYAPEGSWEAPRDEDAPQRALELLEELMPEGGDDHGRPAV